jgi:regulator of protease activity HflC (stomatin/prohibitin superfamily)
MDYSIVVFLVIVIAIIIKNVRVVEQNTVFVISFFGKYKRVMTAGLNFKVPFFESIAEKITLRQQNFVIEGKYPSQDKVIVDVATNLIYTVNPTEVGIQKFCYVLQNRQQSIGAIIENSLRTYIAKETHEGILEKKDELAMHIRNDLEVQFEEWGMNINSFQITNVNFPTTITTAMSEVVASQQLRKAAENK